MTGLEAQPRSQKLIDKFDCMSPVDYRYPEDDVIPYMGENGFTGRLLDVEAALVRVASRRGICSPEIADQVEAACKDISTLELYEEEERIKHDIRALVNCIRKRVPDEAKRFVHLMATSYDIKDTANALRYKLVTDNVAIPSLLDLEGELIRITKRDADVVQIGRTHGQHAIPITFGFAVAEYVSRFGDCINNLSDLSRKLPGKFSGAVGAYNASSLLIPDPERFEEEILAEFDLKPADHSTQIVHPEPMVRLLGEYATIAGVFANLADDMRNLQRSEIAEVGEAVTDQQVSSSTMAQKQNPINWENVKGMWKIIMPRMVTVYMDQISEHQRDLTNSASSRTYGEIVNYTVHGIRRSTRILKTLDVNPENMLKNLKMSKGQIAGEPLYILLAYHGHSDAHEKSRILTRQARRLGISVNEEMMRDPECQDYLAKFEPHQVGILKDPEGYVGKAGERARKIAEDWEKHLGL